MLISEKMAVIKTRQCKVVVVVTVMALLCFFLMTAKGGKDLQNLSIRKRKALDLSTLTLNVSLEKNLEDHFKIKPIKSRGATIFVDDIGRVRIPPANIVELMQFRDLEEQYHRYLESIQVPCTRQIHLGNHQDGGYDICENPSVVPQKPCLVYSFGVRNDFSFDERLSQIYGCDVHSFDPANGMVDHQHSPNVYFHSMGLWKADEVLNDNWKMRTLDSIKTELSHTKADVALMKIDIEGGEWDALPQMLRSGALKGVRQLIMEFHSWVDLPPWTLDHRDREHYKHHLNVLRDLYDEGFRIFFFKRFPAACCLYEDEFNIHRVGCHEIHMMRVE